MRQEAEPVRVLDYAQLRRRFPVHLPTMIVSAVLVLILNVSPHFITTVGDNTSDLPEPEFGWPWVFYFYGEMYSGFGSLLIPEHFAYDLICGVLFVVVAGHVAGRVATRR